MEVSNLYLLILLWLELSLTATALCKRQQLAACHGVYATIHFSVGCKNTCVPFGVGVHLSVGVLIQTALPLAKHTVGAHAV